MGTMQDPFQEIPIYNPPANERVTNVDSSDVLAFIKNSARRPFGVQESSGMMLTCLIYYINHPKTLNQGYFFESKF